MNLTSFCFDPVSFDLSKAVGRWKSLEAPHLLERIIGGLWYRSPHQWMRPPSQFKLEVHKKVLLNSKPPAFFQVIRSSDQQLSQPQENCPRAKTSRKLPIISIFGLLRRSISHDFPSIILFGSKLGGFHDDRCRCFGARSSKEAGKATNSANMPAGGICPSAGTAPSTTMAPGRWQRPHH